MAIKLGMNAKAYYGPAGAMPPSANELDNVRDVTINLEKAEADVTTRGNNGWRATVGTLKDGTVEFEMIWDTEDTGFAAIQAAYFADTSIALAFLDGPGGDGLAGDFSVTNLTRNEALEEAITASVTVRPTYSVDFPTQWVTNGTPAS